MPVFREEASPEMLNREYGIIEPRLPRQTPPPPHNPSNPLSDGAKHEVVVIGTGPAGMMLSLMLTRYGVSVLAVDKQTTRVISGHADGIQPRTLEILRQLGLAEEIFRQGNPNYKIAFWNPKKGGGIERTAVTDDVTVPGRYPFKILLAAGRVVGILERQMMAYGGRAQRGVEMVRFRVMDEGEFPVEVVLREVQSGRVFTVYAKHLVGADGAHSKVRAGIGGEMIGESTDYLWGVVDAVVNTDFPDIRKRCAIHSDSGSIMCIPRERIENGKYLTRLYTQMESNVMTPSSAFTNSKDPEEMKKSYERALAQRREVTLPRIFEQVAKTLRPFKLDVEKVDWWGAYQIGQRVSSKFVLKDKSGYERVLIMGDACHTHSPKAGQGMNVSMMDGYNLSWKLAHEILGLCPRGSLLPTYELERADVARQLIAFDTRFAGGFSRKIGVEVTHEEFFGTFREGGGFTSGCGIEYPPSLLTLPETIPSLLPTSENTALLPGRRLFSLPATQFAGEIKTHLHDILPVTGVYQILLLLPQTFKSPQTRDVWYRRAEWAGAVLPDRYEVVGDHDTASVGDTSKTARGRATASLIHPYLLYPLSRTLHCASTGANVEWTDFPPIWRDRWWGNVLAVGEVEGYASWGVDPEKGAVVVVRPDGVVGGVWDADEVRDGGGVETWAEGVMRARRGGSGFKERRRGEARL